MLVTQQEGRLVPLGQSAVSSQQSSKAESSTMVVHVETVGSSIVGTLHYYLKLRFSKDKDQGSQACESEHYSRRARRRTYEALTN
jgi:hypothetical protein